MVVAMKASLAIPLIVLVVLFATSALAQVPNSILDTLQNDITAEARSWESNLLASARTLFFLLALIEVGIAAIWLAINTATLEQWFGELVRRIIFIGFFLFILTQGPALGKAIVDSLWLIGSGNGKLSPADIFDSGIAVADRLGAAAEALPWRAIAQKLLLGICGILVVLGMGLLAAILLAVIVEMYLGLIAGMILLGFGGSSFTKDFAIKYMVYAFSVGMKIMALVMIASIAANVLTGLAANQALLETYSGPIVLAALAIISFVLGMYVPGIIQGLVQGVSVGSGMEAIRSAQGTGSYAASSGRVAAGGVALIGSGVAAGASATMESSRSGSSAGAAVAKGIFAGIAQTGGALASAAKDQAIGAPGSYGTSTLGLANAKLDASRSTPRPAAAGKSDSAPKK